MLLNLRSLLELPSDAPPKLKRAGRPVGGASSAPAAVGGSVPTAISGTSAEDNKVGGTP